MLYKDVMKAGCFKIEYEIVCRKLLVYGRALNDALQGIPYEHRLISGPFFTFL